MLNKILNIGSNSSLVDVNIPGILTTSTPTSSSSNNQVATKEYVDTQSAPELFWITLDKKLGIPLIRYPLYFFI